MKDELLFQHTYGNSNLWSHDNCPKPDNEMLLMPGMVNEEQNLVRNFPIIYLSFYIHKVMKLVTEALSRLSKSLSFDMQLNNSNSNSPTTARELAAVGV